MEILDNLLKNIIKHPEQGYALYYYHNGNIINHTNGVLSTKDSQDITSFSNFRLASVSKQFIAFGIVDLILKGMLSFDTCIKTIFIELPDYFKDITVMNLLNHTSGIYDYEDMPHQEDDPQLQDDDIITFLKTTDKTYFKVGTKYKYSNTAYILLGLIIKKISGQSIGEYLEQNVFNKAGMFSTKVNYQGITEIDNRAYGHLLENNELVVQDQYWCSATIGDGGIYSSINDLKKWAMYLVNTPHFQEMRKANYLGPNEYNCYGLGLRIIQHNNKEIIYHCGDTIGTNTLLLFSQELNLILIFLTNLGGIDTEIIKNNLLEILK